MKSLNGTLVTLYSTDGLKLKGFLATSKEGKVTIIHIHGFSGNFYENDFISVMAEKYTEAGLNFLAFGSRGHDCIAEAYQDGRLVYVGGAYERLGECVHDIEGAIGFARQLGDRVILQGHSLGCLKVLIYSHESKRPLDIILLSPSDTYALQKNYIFPEPVANQISRIKRDYNKRDALLPPHEFGINQGKTTYHIPISAGALIDLLESPLIGLLRYEGLAEYFLNIKAFIYLGGQDTLQTETKDKVEQFFTSRIREPKFLYCPEGDHHFHKLENLVADNIVAWANG